MSGIFTLGSLINVLQYDLCPGVFVHSLGLCYLLLEISY